MLHKCCPWLFPASDTKENNEQTQGLLDEENPASSGEGDKPAKGIETIQTQSSPTPQGTASGDLSEYQEEMQQLSNIVALMLAEEIFAYQTPFKIKLEQQFQMMFDLQLSFSFDSLKEAERQLMNALGEIFDNKPASTWFFEQLNEQMADYVNGLSQTEKFEYKNKSGYGRPEKLEVVLEGTGAPALSSSDTVKITVKFWDSNCSRDSPFIYELSIMRYGEVSGESQGVADMKSK